VDDLPKSPDDRPGRRPQPGPRFGGPGYVDLPDDDRTLTEEELAGLRGETTIQPPPSASGRVLPLQLEPSRLVEDYLFPSEKFRGEWRRHKIYLWKEITYGLLATVIIGLITGYFANPAHQTPGVVTFLVVLWLLIIGWAMWRIVDWHYDRFILTNKRVMLVRGFIKKDVAMMPLLRVTDMKYTQSPLGRMLEYGTFEIESAGQEQALRRVKHLPNPNELYLKIVEEMYEPEAVDRRLGSVVSIQADDDGT
jgi:membrane protein YdbS with pleckstrin-like domain